MTKLFFTIDAQQEFLALDKGERLFIQKKLNKIARWEWFKLKVLTDMEPYTHRLRVWDYRLLVRACVDGYEVGKIGHRSTIYKLKKS